MSCEMAWLVKTLFKKKKLQNTIPSGINKTDFCVTVKYF